MVSVSAGLLVIRVVLGLLFAAHGAQKLLGWFEGPGLKGTAGWLQSMGVRPAMLMAIAAAGGEFAGGLLFALGLFTWFAAILIVVPMIVAIAKVHGTNGLWATKNGYEYNLVIIAIAVGVAFTGAGDYSLDHWLF
ncbi:DoxX family protein [Paenibacillus mendelii]|uniref:DoxX family protein n=1 Tax=Paenibacillus mendelii TaxID=206163 RepID=A0ABV6JJ91_9BACL|nr:DoxX family protein [Paenibacillus mendelii]MCQ6558678.1 DoxX family protein [Paenibacillus mendelii]